MLRKLYFVKTNGYNMVVSVDNKGNCRYLTETEEFPYIVGMNDEEQQIAANEFLSAIEDDSGWKDDCEYDEIFAGDEIEVIGLVEKWL